MANVAKQNNITVEVVVESEKQDGCVRTVGSGCVIILIRVSAYSPRLRRRLKSGMKWNDSMLDAIY
jgi:hypothetical protein